MWNTAELRTHFDAYEGEIYRLVEGQHFIATRKLVDSDEEQAILEQALDHSKPATVTSNARGKLHYLLYTPFRYPPLKGGARFHTRFEQSIFYGAEELETAMAEIAHGRFLFARHTQAELQGMLVPYTHFVAKVKAGKALKLTRAPFAAERGRISDPHSYAYSQSLGRQMREAETELFTYFSARRAAGVNVGLFTPEAFALNRPVAGKDKHWEVYITREVVEFQRPRIAGVGKEAVVFQAGEMGG